MRRRWPRHALGAACGIAADALLGEPGMDPHPVSAFGTFMARVEGTLYRDDRTAGLLHAALGVAVGAGAGVLLRSAAVATYLAVASRALIQAAQEVAGALDGGDLPRARQLLPALVGRDPSHLDREEIARAVVESLAENTVDAVVAPALWAAAFGAPGALGYRAVNTLDSMVGHRSDRYRRYGWASARLDDVANFVPARVTAALVVVVRPGTAGAVWRAVRQDAPHHPSPNAGVAEAAFAAAQGLALGGINAYGDRVERRPALGDGRRPQPQDIAATIALCNDVTAALAAVLVVVAIVGAVT